VIFDSIVNDEYPISDNFSEAEYSKYLQKADISDVLSRESVLRNLSCAGIAHNGCLSYTNAGLLFFRDNRKNLYFDFTHVICALYKGIDKVDIIDAKNLDGGIMENIDNAMVFLKRNLRVRYEIKTVQRKNILELPEDALREAVINSVCHRDYFEKGARAMVEIFDDRVEITNPGSVPKGITKDNFGNTSVTRNPVIASLLHRAHYIERMGTGIMRMNRAMETSGLEKPVFQTDGYFFKVIFKRTEVDVLGDSQTIVKQSPINGESVIVNGANNDANNGANSGANNGANNVNRKAVLDLIMHEPTISLDEISKRAKIPQRTLDRIIMDLKSNNMIKRIGSKRSGYWQVFTD